MRAAIARLLGVRMAWGGAAFFLSVALTPAAVHAQGLEAGMPACHVGTVCVYVGNSSADGYVVYDANQGDLVNGNADINLGDLLGNLGNGNLGNGNAGNGKLGNGNLNDILGNVLGNVDLNNLGDLANLPDAIVNCLPDQVLNILGNNGALLASVQPLSGSVLQSDAATGVVPVQSVSSSPSIYLVNPGAQNVATAEVLPPTNGQVGQTGQVDPGGQVDQTGQIDQTGQVGPRRAVRLYRRQL